MMTVTKLRRIEAALLAGILLMTFAAVAIMASASGERSSEAANVAVVDRAATADVLDAVTQGVEDAFAYDYRDGTDPEEAGADFMVGDAREQFQELYQQLAAEGAEQELVFHTQVTAVGVQHLVGSDAEVLVFVVQNAHRGTDGGTNRAPAQFRAALNKEEGTWRVFEIDML
jgi:Mce-associated membrane protein